MSLDLIRQALEVRLATINPPIDSVPENTNYVPSVDVAYQRVSLLPAAPTNPEMTAGNRYQEQGILQVGLCYPINKGAADAQARAVLIRNTFPRGTTMTAGGVSVQVDQTPEIGRGDSDGDCFFLPVRVHYFANINL